MGVKFDWRYFTVKGRGGSYGFEARPVIQLVCDLCGADAKFGETQMCPACRRSFAVIAVQARQTFGRAITANDIRTMKSRLNPHGIDYGKPWQHHLPPHERAHYGLHT